MDEGLDGQGCAMFRGGNSVGFATAARGKVAVGAIVWPEMGAGFRVGRYAVDPGDEVPHTQHNHTTKTHHRRNVRSTHS